MPTWKRVSRDVQDQPIAADPERRLRCRRESWRRASPIHADHGRFLASADRRIDAAVPPAGPQPPQPPRVLARPPKPPRDTTELRVWMRDVVTGAVIACDPT